MLKVQARNEVTKKALYWNLLGEKQGDLLVERRFSTAKFSQTPVQEAKKADGSDEAATTKMTKRSK